MESKKHLSASQSALSDKQRTQLEKQIQDLEEQAAEHLHGWKKALADYQNLQKDTAKKFADLSDFITSGLILELLPIFDNYQTAMSHIPEADKEASWAVGLGHILKMWESFLSDHQISKISTVGQKFDPHIHEAVDKVHDSQISDQEIVKELQAGYLLKEVVIRPAKVIVNNLP
ncbi:MAG: nucleotide exchange factor GrpE [Patescibacteria group bacterium]